VIRLRGGAPLQVNQDLIVVDNSARGLPAGLYCGRNGLFLHYVSERSGQPQMIEGKFGYLENPG
jgi:hypothetical protein